MSQHKKEKDALDVMSMMFLRLQTSMLYLNFCSRTKNIPRQDITEAIKTATNIKTFKQLMISIEKMVVLYEKLTEDES